MVLERVEVGGVAVTRLGDPAKELLHRTDGRVTLVAFEADSAERAFLKKVEMNLPQIRSEKDFPWSGKHLGPQDMATFASLIGRYGPLPHVQNIYMYSNYIGDEGLIAFAPTIGSMPQLANLFLHGNEIGSKGVECLCAHAPPHELVQLTLWGNHIGDEGMKALVSAIDDERLRMRQLVIHGNKCSPKMLDKIAYACADARGTAK